MCLLFLSGSLCQGCEGYRCADGIVLDKSTNQPLDSILVEVIIASELIYTDATGAFDVCNQFGGCMPACKDIEVQFSKNGYKTVTLINPKQAENVLMEHD